MRLMCGPKSILNDLTFLEHLKKPPGVEIKLDELIQEVRNGTKKNCKELLTYNKVLNRLIAGDILVAPDTPEVRKMVSKMNETFHKLNLINPLFSLFYDTMPQLTDLATKNSLYRVLRVFYSFFGEAANEKTFKHFNGLLMKLENKSIAVQQEIGIILKLSKCFDFDRFRIFKNESTMMKYVTSKSPKNILAGIVYNFSYNGNDLKYKIRLDQYIGLAFLKNPLMVQRIPINPRLAPNYVKSGLVYLQDLIESSYLWLKTNRDDIGVVIQQFPSRCYVEDIFMLIMTFLFPIFMLISWLVDVPTIVGDLVYEKESGVEQFIMVGGVSVVEQWFAWFLVYLSTKMISVSLLCLLLFMGGVLEHSSVVLIFIFLSCFVIALITQCFTYSVFFESADSAAAFSCVSYFISYMPYVLCEKQQLVLSACVKILASLSFTSSFAFGCNYIALAESKREGIHFSSISMKGGYTFFTSMWMMLFDSVWHTLLALYVKEVFPGSYGVPKPWYFPFLPIIKLFGFDERKRYGRMLSIHPIDKKALDEMETMPDDLRVGVRVEYLVKYFADNLAVNHVRVDFYDNQITGLLGNNGSGKTTMMSIIVGLVKPTKGNVYIGEYDVRSSIDKIRQSISLCPQHNILYPSLTVYEHLQFYSQLKQNNIQISVIECDKILKDLNLEEKKNSKVKELSGGMKRKLSIGIAYIGSPAVVVLDEPTAGVDAVGRRSIWDLIQKYKSNRTTVLSTQLMDEADFLCDRIAILYKGKLCTCGSRMFLKKRYGKGYTLTVEIPKNDKNPQKIDTEIHQKINELVKKHVEAIDSNHHYNTLVYILPQDKETSILLPNLFKDLDSLKSDFQIKGFGISSPSLEEIYIKVINTLAEKLESDLENSEHRELIKFQSMKEIEDLNEKNKTWINPHHGFILKLNQIKALFKKRSIYLRRSKKIFFFQILFPSVFMAIMFIVIKINTSVLAAKNEEFESHACLQQDENECRHSILFSKDNKIPWDSSGLKESFINLTRLRKDESKNKINEIQISKRLPTVGKHSYPISFSLNCRCVHSTMVCDSKHKGILPPRISNLPGATIKDLTNYDLSSYLIETHHFSKLYKNGGFEFVWKDPEKQIKEALFLKLVHAFEALGKAFDSELSYVPNISQNIIQLDIDNRKQNLLKVWFNYEVPFPLASMLNLANNVLLKEFSNDSSNSSNQLHLYSHPFFEKTFENFAMKFLEVLSTIGLLFTFSLIPSSFVFLPMEEKKHFFQQLEVISGFSPLLYWVINLAIDYLLYSVAAAVCFLVVVLLGVTQYTSYDNCAAFLLLIFNYGLILLPTTYSASDIFTDANFAYICLCGFNFFVGLIPNMVTLILDLIPEAQSAARDFDLFWCILPQYCFGRAMLMLSRNHVFKTSHGMDYQVAGRYVYLLMLNSVSSIIGFLFTKKFNFWHELAKWRTCKYESGFSRSEEDVVEEDKKVFENRKDYVVSVYRLTKLYNSKSWPFRPKFQYKALDNVSFGIKRSECIGLLGSNGAGKTTLFKILTGDMEFASGALYMGTRKMSKRSYSFRNKFGYCPQFDGLCNLMTPKEHIKYFAKIKGYSKKNLEEMANWAIEHFDLTQSANTLAKNLSGGNKRKLGFALASLGKPAVLYLDEPTAGIDPIARRNVWNCIINGLNEGTSVLLTSHSFDECETLCGKIVMMFRGEIAAIGTVQHLKEKYAKGYIVDVKMKDTNLQKNSHTSVRSSIFRRSTISKASRHGSKMIDINSLYGTKSSRVNIFTEFMKLHFPDCTLLEHHGALVKLQLSPSSSSSDLAFIFSKLNDAADMEMIEDFSINQTNLEQVFIKLSNDFKDSEEIKNIQVG